MLLCFCLLKLREQMLGTMTSIVGKVPTNTSDEVQVVARSLTALTQEGSELSPTAQVQCWFRNNIIGGRNKSSICHYCVISLSALFTEVHSSCWWIPNETTGLTFTIFVHSRQGVWGWITNVFTTNKCHLTPTKNVCLISTSRKRLHCYLETLAHLSSTWRWTVMKEYNLQPAPLLREQETSWIILPMWAFNLTAPALMGFTSWGKVGWFRYCIYWCVIAALQENIQYVCSFVSTAQVREKQLLPCHKCFLCRKTSLMSFSLL